MIVRVDRLDLVDTFVTFFALLGPEEALLTFARVTRAMGRRATHKTAIFVALAAASVGVVSAMVAPWLISYFRIGTPALKLAAGILYFVYALGLVIGVRLDSLGTSAAHNPGEPNREESIETLTVISAFREMLLPFVVNPLAVAAVLEWAQSVHGWGGRLTVAGTYTVVAALDLACLSIFTPLFRRTYAIAFELLSRLSGLLFAAVGVEVFLQGLTTLGVLRGHGGPVTPP
jgi:small neutral amino acid transporter SnatA (MarC family)